MTTSQSPWRWSQSETPTARTRRCIHRSGWRSLIGSTGGYCAVIAHGGEPLAEYLHLTPDAALAHFEELRAAAIARIEKQIRTLPDRLGKLKARKPVIKE